MLAAVLTAAVLGPDLLKCGGDFVYLLCEQSGKLQKPESVEEPELLLGEFH